jgi:pyroglutamyl-peptidase
MTILLTGFGPFAQTRRNPSEQIVAALAGSSVDGHEIVGRVLPVSAERTPAAVRTALDEVRPDLALLLGVAPGRAALAIERVAINVFDFDEPDNDGARPVDVPIDADGAPAYFARLPLRRILAAWHEAGVPGYLSDTAGTYLCNAAMYTALHVTAARRLPAGFVHLPSLPDEVAAKTPPQPSMPLAVQVEGVRLALEVAVGDAGAP